MALDCRVEPGNDNKWGKAGQTSPRCSHEQGNLSSETPASIKDAAARLAKEDGVSLNQWIAVAVAEKVAALRAADHCKERAGRADFEAFDRFMSRENGAPPRPDDAI